MDEDEDDEEVNAGEPDEDDEVDDEDDDEETELDDDEEKDESAMARSPAAGAAHVRRCSSITSFRNV